MITVQPDKILKMFHSLCKYHKGEIYGAYLDWEIQQYYNPRYDCKIDQLCPLVVLEFK